MKTDFSICPDAAKLRQKEKDWKHTSKSAIIDAVNASEGDKYAEYQSFKKKLRNLFPGLLSGIALHAVKR